jgi:hypothetical protein
VDDTAVLIKYTWSGDADLTGVVELADYNRLAFNFGESGRIWSDGDFNFDGTVDLTDFNLMSPNFGQQPLGPMGTMGNGGNGGGGDGDDSDGTGGYTIAGLLDHLLSGGHGLPIL